MKTKTKISGYILRRRAAALLFSCAVVALSSAITIAQASSTMWPEGPAPSLSNESAQPAKSQQLDADGTRLFAKLFPNLARVSQLRQISAMSSNGPIVNPSKSGPVAAQRELEGPWGQPLGSDPCGSERHLEDRLAKDPSLASRRETLERMVGEAQRKGLLPSHEPTQPLTGTPIYVIPVAVHIVHQGGAENISDNQVLSQIDALNRDFQNLVPSPFPATDTQIQFCLAQNLPPGSTVTWSTTPGITRTVSPETVHTFGSGASEAALKAIDYLPSDRYLNIWVVKQILGGSGGVVGYGTFPGTVPPTLDGIVMWYRVFGSNHTGYGNFPSLIPSNDDGKVLTHEVGHNLDLFHTFHLGCTGFNSFCLAPNDQGDCVTDTSPEEPNNVGCPTPAPISCSSSAPIENFMDYTNDTCRFAFTAGQTERMHAAIGVYRSLLVSAGNLIFTGCSSGLNALILASPGQVCPGDTIQFDTPASGNYTYAWTFSGGTPATATTKMASASFTAVGPHTVTLTVTAPNGDFSTNITTIYVVNCTPILSSQGNWYFGDHAGLNFSLGLPVADINSQMYMDEGTVTQSDQNGNLLFYSNGVDAWDRTHTLMNPGNPLKGHGSASQSALSVPDPANPNRYYLFTVPTVFNPPADQGFWYTIVDFTINSNGQLTNINTPIPLPTGATTVAEQQTAVPQCNGTDYWIIVHGVGANFSDKFFVYSLTSSGLSTPSIYSGAGGGRIGQLKASPDGTRIAQTGGAFVFEFDKLTGTISNPISLPHGDYGVSFSPNSEILYVTESQAFNYGYEKVFQYDLLQTNPALSEQVVATIQDFFVLESSLQLGPDNRIYVAVRFKSFMAVINYPDQLNSVSSPNACGFNYNGPSLKNTLNQGGHNTIGLPNMIDAKSGTLPADFDYLVSNCLTVAFINHTCGMSYLWDFGDGQSSTAQNPTHTYGSPGTYNVQLTVTGANPPTVTIPITLMASTVTIAGPLQTCRNPSNYSAAGPPGYSYHWTITGGNPTSATGNNVDVIWGSSGGTLTVLGTDPSTGCTSTATLNVAPCGCQFSTSSSNNFNNFRINAGNYIWFTSVLKADHLGSTAVTITFTNQTITSPSFGPLSVPDATVIFDPNVTMASTVFAPVTGVSTTTVPSNPTLKGNTFFSGLSFPVPANLPGSIHPVTWSGTISTATPGVKVNWQWAAAVYTSFNADYTTLGVKPVDDKVHNPYLNSDHAGTPESYKPFVIGGATGGGASNYTGSLGPTKSVGPCRP